MRRVVEGEPDAEAAPALQYGALSTVTVKRPPRPAPRAAEPVPASYQPRRPTEAMPASRSDECCGITRTSHAATIRSAGRSQTRGARVPVMKTHRQHSYLAKGLCHGKRSFSTWLSCPNRGTAAPLLPVRYRTARRSLAARRRLRRGPDVVVQLPDHGWEQTAQLRRRDRRSRTR
jgi:hypothetical protein